MNKAVAVLVSGGIDSAVLAIELTRCFAQVFPLYLRHGLQWEEVELTHLIGFLAAVGNKAVSPVSVLELPVDDLYQSHWSLSGVGVPDGATDDDAVYLPGRNLLFLAKAGVWCERKGIATVALAPLKGNPFSDNTGEFYSAMETALHIALGHPIKVVRPFAEMSKADVIGLGSALPLHLTFSCIDPVDGKHCGRCNKCAERRRAFEQAGMPDLTDYARPSA